MTEALSWLLIYSKSVEGTGIIGLLQQKKHVEKKTGNDAALEAEFQLLMTVSNPINYHTLIEFFTGPWNNVCVRV